MLTKRQLAIFGVFKKNLFREYTMGEIKRSSKEKSNNAITLAIRSFREEGLIKERRIGRSLLCMPDLTNDLVYSYISIIDHSVTPKTARKAITAIKDEISRHTPFYSLIIFGSYAEGKQTKTSDLDIAAFIDRKSKKAAQAAIDAAGDRSPIDIDGHAISDDEFLEMLKEEDENLGKEIARKHLAIHNPHIFYAILQQGVKNGFRM